MVHYGLNPLTLEMIKIECFKRKMGTTYYLTDVGYHKDKIDRKYEHYINIFGADHHGYVKRIASAFDTLKNDYQSLEIVLYQLVNLF